MQSLAMPSQEAPFFVLLQARPRPTAAMQDEDDEDDEDEEEDPETVCESPVGHWHLIGCTKNQDAGLGESWAPNLTIL